MVRNRQRKTNIGQHEEEKMKKAIDMIHHGRKIYEVAKNLNIPYTTLYRYYQKIRKGESDRFTPNYANRRVFSENQEKTLVDFIVACAQMFYGLTTVEVRQLAYEVAVRNNINMPQKWHENRLAGIDWLYHFKKRHQTLSLRVPEGCSLSRATSFNRYNVNKFYDNLWDVMQREPTFGNGTRIFNLDETNTMTVQKSAKVLAVRGQKQVSKVTSAEKGTLVTTCYIISALGHALPPVMIFPRVHFKEHMLAGAPTGTLGLANPSGWMNSALFVKTMEHFIKNTQSSKENPSLLIMDNYEAHICIEAITLAKDNGVTILTVPPHSTGKLQPLDVGLFKPFKVAYNSAIDSWLTRNPGKTFSIYEVAQAVKEAHLKAMTPANICSSFQSTGIFPFNRDIFTDLDFAPSTVTDRDIEPLNINPTANLSTSDNQEQQHTESFSRESPVRTSDFPIASTSTPTSPPRSRSPLRILERPSTSKEFVSPLEFRGLPKAGPRKSGRAARRKGKSIIATDTPNKLEIEKRNEDKKQKQRKKDAGTKKRKILQSESSEEDSEHMSLYSEEEGDGDDDYCDEVCCITEEKLGPLEKQPNEGDFILVKFATGNKNIFYIGKVIRGGDGIDVEVSYLRKSSKVENSFQLPNVPDLATVALEDIKMILPKPFFAGGTKRQQGYYKFNVNFQRIDLR